MSEHSFISYSPPRLAPDEMHRRALELFQAFDSRRSVRHFSSEPVPRELVEIAIRSASTAPSGAHRQPWTFVAISDPKTKRQIRVAAEKEEHQSYEGGRMPSAWRDALRPMGTDWHKEYLEVVPWIVVVLEKPYSIGQNGEHIKNYYVKESVGIACGLFIIALHQMGLSTLTHTPSPMGFLSELLGRPENERPFILFPVGFPSDDATVPDIRRRELDEISVWFE